VTVNVSREAEVPSAFLVVVAVGAESITQTSAKLNCITLHLKRASRKCADSVGNPTSLAA
jgi:hypothetical protein